MITITTNYHWHDFIYGFELSDKEKEQFDYIDSEDTRYFIRYRDMVYDLNEFSPIANYPGTPKQFDGWNNYLPDSFFSGILIKFSEDYEQYRIATYIG